MLVKILMANGEHEVLDLAKTTAAALKWCDLVTVTDGREAARLLQGEKFHGVIVGDRVAELDSFELTHSARQSPLNAGVPIVMLTGDDNINTMRRGFKAGVTFFAVTPRSRERFYHLFNAVHGSMESERRRHHRLPYQTPVTVCFGEQGQHRCTAETMEIGEGGVGVKPSGALAVGQVVELEFLFPQVTRPASGATTKSRAQLFAEREALVAGPQKVRATVRYTMPQGAAMGLDFQGLTSAQRQVIRRYIAGDS